MKLPQNNNKTHVPDMHTNNKTGWFVLPKFGCFDGLPGSQLRQHNANDVYNEDKVNLEILAPAAAVLVLVVVVVVVVVV